MNDAKLQNDKLVTSFEQKFQDYKKSILGEEGLGAIPIKIKEYCSAIGDGLQSIGEGVGKGLESIGEGIGKVFKSLKFW